MIFIISLESAVEPNISSADDTVPLTILLAAVAAIFALSAILLFLCCYQRRQKQLEAGSTGIKYLGIIPFVTTPLKGRFVEFSQ